MLGVESVGQLSQCLPLTSSVWILIGAFMLLLMLVWGRRTVRTILTFRALALAPSISRVLSSWLRSCSYSENRFLRADGAGEQWVERRRKALNGLSNLLKAQGPQSIAWGNEVRDGLSDLRFTDANRVPFPFMRVMREKFTLTSVVTASTGPWLRDLDSRLTLATFGRIST
jgi:glutamate-1-semialdehyde 2,1-aminomutase